MPSSALPWYLKGVLKLAIPAACLAALYLSIPGEIAMARTAGWAEEYAWAMPVCISVYALAAGAITTYRRRMNLPGQTTALIGALFALGLAIAAQSISHLMALGYMETSALLVRCISAVPPLVIAHLVHMAETPSQVKTADEKMGDLRDMVDFLSLQLLDSHTSQAVTLIARSETVANQGDALTQLAETVTNEGREAVEELDRALNTRARRGRVRTITRDMVEGAVMELRSQNEKVTGLAVAGVLGLSESSFYRLPSDVRAAAV